MGRTELNDDVAVKRWLDADEPSGKEAPPPWVLDLVKSAPPISVTAAQRGRLLLRLSEGKQHRRTVWLRPIVVGMFLLGGTTIASAAFTDWPANLVRACRNLVAHPRSADSAPSEAASRRRTLEHHQAAVVAEAAAVPAELEMPAPVARRTGSDNRVRSRVHADVGPAEDPSLVVEATRALRVARDARRARVLAARYLHEQPGGALAEEALAIVVEAAVAEQDPDASVQAAQYLNLYPHGPFRAAAQRALSAR